MSRSSDLVRLMLMAKLSSIKKTAICPRSLLGARFQQQQFVDDALVGAKADRIAEKSRHGAEFAAIRAAAPGLHRNNAERSPARADFAQHAALQNFRDDD